MLTKSLVCRQPMCQVLIAYKTIAWPDKSVSPVAVALISTDTSALGMNQTKAFAARLIGVDCTKHVTTPFDESLPSIIEQMLAPMPDAVIYPIFAFTQIGQPDTELTKTVLNNTVSFNTQQPRFCVSAEAVAYAGFFQGYVRAAEDIHASGLAVFAIMAGAVLSMPQRGGCYGDDEFADVFGTSEHPSHLLEGIWLLEEEKLVIPGVEPSVYFQKYKIALSMPIQQVLIKTNAQLNKHLRDSCYTIEAGIVSIAHTDIFVKDLTCRGWTPVMFLVHKIGHEGRSRAELRMSK